MTSTCRPHEKTSAWAKLDPSLTFPGLGQVIVPELPEAFYAINDTTGSKTTWPNGSAYRAALPLLSRVFTVFRTRFAMPNIAASVRG